MDNLINRMELLKQIMAADFMVEDFQLYLNTHPEDTEAIARYNMFLKQSLALKQQYENNFGMLSEDSTTSRAPWNWINEPWPWKYEANFKL